MDDKHLPEKKWVFLPSETKRSAFMLFIFTPLAFWLVPKIVYFFTGIRAPLFP